MSDILNTLCLEKLTRRLDIDTDHCLNYIRRQCISSTDIVLTVHVPHDCLRQWYDAKQGVLRETECTYVQILNACIRTCPNGVKIQDGERIEGRLRRSCLRAKQKFRGKSGAEYRKLMQDCMKIGIRADEILTISNIESDLQEEVQKNEQLQHENEELQNKCTELYSQVMEAQATTEELNTSLEEATDTIKRLENENKALHSYINKLGQELQFENESGTVGSVRDRQQRRKITELKTKVEKALWFAKTFGLDLQSVSLLDESGKSHTITYSDEKKKPFKDLPEEEQKKVKSILFVLDKFCIGDAAYHELTMSDGGEDLPRSYLIKQCKDDLNKLCHIKRTPGQAEGAQLDFKSELESVIKTKISQEKLNIEDPDFKLKIKISGDGAKMSRLTSFVVISFSVLNNEEDVMSSRGNHTVAVIKGQESYELLQTSCATVFQQANKLIKEGKVSIDGREIPIELFLGGDYKFLLLVLGMKAATSDYACIWCEIHKKDRFDMTKPQEFYWGKSIVRTLEKVKECAKKGKFSCEHQPLLNIPLVNVVLDELHLMLRVTDKLTKNLVLEALEWDKKDNLNKPPSKRSSMHLTALVNTIVSCGVSFSVWEKQDADGKGSGLYDFTSLMGAEKKLLLQNLPQKLQTVIKPETSKTVVQIWKDFNQLYALVGQKNPTTQQVMDYFVKAHNWVTLFQSLGGRCLGYEKARVTPYMHGMVYHVPRFMTRHQGIKKFTGQGVEKLNDDCRRIHLQRSNKWDAAKDVLLVGKRMEHLAAYERTPRQYNKKAKDYWEGTIRDVRAKRRRLCLEVPEAEKNMETGGLDIENMSAEDLKSELNKRGITTRVRNLKKLQQLLRNDLMQAESSTE